MAAVLGSYRGYMIWQGHPHYQPGGEHVFCATETVSGDVWFSGTSEDEVRGKIDEALEEEGVMGMTQEEFIVHVAGLTAGLQVPVSISGNPDRLLGPVAGPHWSALVSEATGGFGWTDKEKLAEAFTAILAGQEVPRD